MASRGVHFALAPQDVESLRALEDEGERLDHLQEVIEEGYFADHKDFVAETDKAWDAIHRALSDGELTWDGGDYPLNHAVLAGELLYTDDDYIMSLKTPAQVIDIAGALAQVTASDFRQRYFAIDADSYGFPLTDEDFEYTWGWFETLREFYARAATARRHVLFTADQ